MTRVTEPRGMPSESAARVKLWVSTTREKTSMAWNLSMSGLVAPAGRHG